jgi:two-component system, chemotaxis family, sensor kinase CheA
VRTRGDDTSVASQALLACLRQLSACTDPLPAEGASAANQPAADSPAAVFAPRRGRTLRVHVDKLDAALDTIYELTVALERLPALRAANARELQEDLIEAHQGILRLSRDLQDRMLSLRMVPVGPTLRGFICAMSRGRSASMRA